MTTITIPKCKRERGVWILRIIAIAILAIMALVALASCAGLETEFRAPTEYGTAIIGTDGSSTNIRFDLGK
jgi:hypothetical protein